MNAISTNCDSDLYVIVEDERHPLGSTKRGISLCIAEDLYRRHFFLAELQGCQTPVKSVVHLIQEPGLVFGIWRYRIEAA